MGAVESIAPTELPFKNEINVASSEVAHSGFENRNIL